MPTALTRYESIRHRATNRKLLDGATSGADMGAEWSEMAEVGGHTRLKGSRRLRTANNTPTSIWREQCGTSRNAIAIP